MQIQDTKFRLVSDYKPTGDQPKAIDQLTRGLESGMRAQTLLGVTGSGKTFTMANVIANLQRPTLVLAHNKTLAAQLCSEFREFFPDNAVEYFVSYYDYFQPEAYIPGKDIYIEKDALINEEIDKLRHRATSAVLQRRDVIIVSSVSCIYSLGDPSEYEGLIVSLAPGMEMSRDQLVGRLVAMNYDRNDLNFVRNTFRVRGDVLEIYPSSSDGLAVRVEFWGDEIENLTEIDVLTGEVKQRLSYDAIFPATHYAVSQERRERALDLIEDELADRVDWFRSQNKLLEAQRIEERTKYDLEMLREVGYCSGIENYSRVMSGREPGSTPYTLLDYFPRDFLLFVDESHVTLPQVHAMSGGDKARKKNLVDFGFRLPSAYDNRPLFWEEFESKLNQVVYVSATPADYERTTSDQIVEQIIRPTGLIDPEIEIRPIEGQVDDLIGEIRSRAGKQERVLVTTLTKKMAEDLTEYLEQKKIRVRYIHHKVETMERTEILRDLRMGVFDVLVGVNLLREGLDLPEVTLVAILDADKEGLLRSETALIQTVGRAARNANGKVILYADVITRSIRAAVEETNRRREIQTKWNEEHGITPQTVVKAVRDLIDLGEDDEKKPESRKGKNAGRPTAPLPESRLRGKAREASIEEMTAEMKEAARALDFERAAFLRDRIAEMKNLDPK